ncbi:hypothetical protein VNO78_00644 [Psophocarpus tetragonolobus]|uniref:Uncharacterized protein n=1 Tax=Psophocarpus tetragonolobus TaxID=3891 RepID=A0AAN9SYN2_PSOTE
MMAGSILQGCNQQTHEASMEPFMQHVFVLPALTKIMLQPQRESRLCKNVPIDKTSHTYKTLSASNTKNVIKKDANDMRQVNSCEHPILICDHCGGNAEVVLSNNDETKWVNANEELNLIH